MTASTKIDYVTLACTAIGIILRARSLEAMTLLWDTQVQWHDVTDQNRLRHSCWYCP